MKPTDVTLKPTDPASWLLFQFDELIGQKALAALPCLKESYFCSSVEDIRQYWYQHKLKAIILVVEKHDTLLEDWVCRLVLSLPEAPLVLLSVESFALDETKLLELGVQPQVLVCRTEHPLNESIKNKLALFCNVKKEAIIELLPNTNIYFDLD